MTTSRKNIENIYGLSPMQQGMLFHALLADDGTVEREGAPGAEARDGSYVVQVAWTIEGALDPAALQSAWQAVVDRHAILRTTFAWEKLAEPLQVVWKHVPFTVERIDLGDLPPDEQRRRIERIAEEDRRSFDLSRAPLMRCTLIRRSNTIHRLVWSVHHALLDGWSQPILLSEFLSLYEAFAQGRELRLERARPYSEYIAWLEKQNPARAAAFWSKQLDGFSASTPLGVDHLPIAGESRFGELRAALPEAEGEALAAFARRSQLTLSTVVHGVYALLLWRYSGEDDVLFGSTVSGRSAALPGMDRMVGLFVNTLPVRAKVPEDQDALGWLRDLQGQLLALRDYEHSPLYEVQGYSAVPRGTPLFESLLAFENFPVEQSIQQARAFAVVDPQSFERTNYPLTVLASFGRTLVLKVFYALQRFETAAVERMIEHLRTLIAGIVARPGLRLFELPLLPESERDLVLRAWNDAAPAFSTDVCVHRLFEEQVDRTPEATALISGAVRWSYRELDQRANRLAHRLRAEGVGPDVLVGVCLPRSVDLVVGLLGILKAGGAYVPIDPNYPPHRMAQYLEDSRAPVLVTLERLRGALPATGAAPVLLDGDAPRIALESEARLEGGAGPRDLAYVLYTSGSTGRPKGVAIEHHSTACLLRWAQEVFTPAELSRVMFSTSICFDLSIFELFVPLSMGGAVVLAENALELPSLAARDELTLINTVPSAMAELVRMGAVPRSVTTVCLAGEALRVTLTEQVYALPHVERVFNLYGPTEDTTYSTWSLVPRVGTPDIGRPIAGGLAYILDPHGQPVPIGVRGELFLGGEGLARGYYGRPDLTAERFVDNPFDRRYGGRLYRTGDVARYLSDGTIEYLGRIDHQVKVRGFRIELGEIEAVLLGDAVVREVVVVAREDGAPGDKRLVAYVVPADGGVSLDVSALRALLEDRLPAHMVPSTFVVLAALPLTPNGKVDRKVLPAPEAHVERERVAPRGPVEEAIAGIFAEVLRLEPGFVGAHDGFFELGGHSLLATQAISRIRATLGVELPLRALFEASTPAELAARVAQTLRGGAEAPPISRAPRTGALALSFAQERMWFLYQLAPDDPSYLVPVAIRLEGALDLDALRRALDDVARRHEVLRTRYALVDGQPAAVVDEGFHLELPVMRLADLSAAERERAAQEAITAELRRPFDLGAAPPIRASLFALGDADHLLLVAMHHILTDGWSMGVLSREVGALYEAFAAGRPSPLPELGLQYADYAAWQRLWLSGETLDEQLAHWKAHLAGAPAALELPTDRPRPPVMSHRGGRRVVELPAELSRALMTLAQREGATLFMVLLAAYATLLSRWSGQGDVVVGTPIAGRTRPETEGLIGLFINTLALRTHLDEERPFRELLARVREVCLGAYAHQDLPFERLVQELHPARDLSRTALFQAMLVLQNAPRESSALATNLRRRGVEADSGTTKFDLTLTLSETPRGLVGSLDYAADLFDAATIDRMAGHLTNLLQAIVAEPGARVGELLLLGADERRRVLVEWNTTAADLGRDACVHALFEAQVDRTPAALALVAGGERLTFAELDRRANRLAHRLRRLGVGPDAVVGLCLDRTADLVVGLLGILKAGGAYLPLDPLLPHRRLEDMLDEAQVRGVVTADRVAAALPAQVPWRVSLDAEAAALAGESEARPGPAAGPHDLVYVLFTSGSTGRPKGVAVEHRNLVAYVRAVAERFALPAAASYAHVSTFSADMGNTVLFPPLCLGGALHLVDEERTRDPGRLADYFEAEGIDCLKIVPSHLAALLSASRPERLVPRQVLALGGEAASLELVERLQQLAPACRIFIHYGPTETTVGAVAGAATRIEAAAIAPLGRPLANNRVYLLDARLAPVPIGVAGELYIGGAQVSRGYLNRPELTAERFVVDPFGEGRLYRTGDRARWLPDGRLLFLGRVDHQVKIRGYRVELGEIEAAFSAHPAVRDAVVLVLDDAGQRLTAFVVTEPRVPAAELSAFVASRLPAYMVPSALVLLDGLPLMPNGKVDRRALSELAPGEAPADAADDGRRTPVEEVLEAIWADMLKRERIGVHERFDELGGHSLLAMQIVARVRDAFRVEVPLRAMFEAPTIAELAHRIEALRSDGEHAPVPPIERAPRGEPLLLSFAQERLWFVDQIEPNSPFYNVPFALRLRGELDVPAFERALREVVRRHEVLRTTFAVVEGRPVQVIHDEVDLRLPVSDLRTLPEAEREARLAELASAEARAPFDLTRGPVLRARLLRLAAGEHALFVVLHHIVSDVYTQRVLREEVVQLYEAFRAGEPSPLPELTLQYADFAVWQRRWLSGEVLERQLAYWKEQLAGAPEALELPTDRPRPAAPSHRGGLLRVELPADLRRALVTVARRRGATLFMVLLAAYATVLSRWSGQRDVVVGAPIAGRTRLEVERLIGVFINALALRVSVDEDEPFTDLLARVREVCLGAYAHQDLPFERLVQELRQARDLSRSPVFQVVLNLQDVRAAGEGLTGLGTGGVAIDTDTVKFDLTLILSESPHGITGTLAYSTDLFDATTVERLMGHLRTLLEGIAAEPARPVCELPLLGSEERRRVLVEWNGTAPRAQDDACVHALFEAQAALSPDAVAVVAGGERVTFSDLDRRANQLAHRLRRLGVGPDLTVGLCLDRTVDFVVGLLGILKAGGAYVPLELSLPQRRLEEILEGAAVRGIVTADRVAGVLPASHAWRVSLDGDAAGLATESAARPERTTAPSHLAYVLFTSGSTGRPKGVAVEHGNVTAYLRGVTERLGLAAGASYIHVSTLAADLGNTVLFPPLCLGGTLHLIDEELTKDPAGLAAYVEPQGVDYMKIVPSHLAALLSAPHPERVLPRRALVLGGEAASRELLERLELLAPGCRLFNHYGPTELTVGIIAGALPSVRDVTAIVALGTPLPAARVYILDARMEPVPIGLAGELYAGGAQVSRGYLGQPAQTAERFVPDPFGEALGARLYRTGDRARWLADGRVQFLGRADHQVKIRGYRVEMGEIEAALEQHPAVRDAVVLALDDAGAGKQLAAFVVAEPPVPAGELQAFLAAEVPAYMVPGTITLLDALPLTPNGKIDRAALAALDRREEQESVAPRTLAEEVLEAIWADVFGRERVGVHERFDDLGGHSLLAIQIIARVRDAFQMEVPLRAIFEAPTIAELAERVEAQRLAGEQVTILPIERAPRGERLPLSFGQERLWFLAQLEASSAFYNVSTVRRLEGPLDAAVLERALREVVRRHEVLRTTFTVVDGEPAQVIHDDVDLRLPVEDLSGSPEVEREARVAELASAEARTPFDLQRGPVLRARLLRLAPDDHVLIVVLHHIVSDVWTQGILHEEAAKLYAAFLTGQPSPLRPLPVQYADFALWQRCWLTGDVLERQIAYWREQLAGAPAALELPTDRPRPAVMSHRGERRRFELSAEVSRALSALGRSSGATLFMVLLAAYATLLSRWSGERDVVVGTPIAGRTRPETEGLIGFFVNTLALRTVLDDEAPFTDLLARVREACLGAYAHQDLPFERLVQELNPVRHLSRTPIFQAAMMLQNAPKDARAAGGLRRREVLAEAGTAKFDLMLALNEGPGGLSGSLEYAADLFDGATIERMLGGFRTLLEGIAAAPGSRIEELPIQSPAEREQVLVAWNRTATAYPRGATIHALFEDQAARTPEAIALVFGEESVSYGELNRRANWLAHRLRVLGVGRESLVGLCVERSSPMVVAMLGILKAGGAYVPLEPTYPKERLAFMIEDAGSPLLLTQRKLAEILPEHGGAVLYLDDALDGQSEANPAGGAAAEDLAYVIYTSGSTGKPKGVAVAHRSVVRLVRDTNYIELGPSDRVAQASNTSFDAATFEIWGALLNGARLIGVAKDLVLAPEAFEVELRRRGVTVFFVTTALFNGLVRERPAIFSTLRCVLFGGELVDPTWVRAALRDGPSRLLHVYGPTETTTFATFHHVEEVPDDAGTVPIGQPLANTTAYVLDAHGGPVPIGVPGELYLGGDALARGYLDRPELTAQRFVPDPFSAEPGARLYWTGDRVRRLADGAVVFLGRRDDQIKLRGFRIELGEIEAALLAHPGVREAVVLAREDVPGERHLCAYLVGGAEHEAPPLGALRAFLKDRLPEYMMPSAFVVLPALPLTPNGKVDRRALPAPEAEEAHEPLAPSGPVEETLCRILGEVLRLKRAVGVDDNFFELGGDSILSIQIVARARAAGIAITARQIFEHQTVAELAKVAGVVGAAPEDQGPVVGPVPLTPIQCWWLEDDPIDPHHFNQSVLLEPREPLEPVALEEAARDLLEHHDALRLRVTRGDGGWAQEIAAPGGSAPFQRIDLGDLPEGGLAAALGRAATEVQGSLDLAAGRIFRVVLFTAGSDERQRILVVVHHFVVDGVSWRILLDDLGKAYEARRRGEPPSLPARTTSIQRWSARLVEHTRSEAVLVERGYWLAAARSRVRLAPVDHPGGEGAESSTRSVNVSLPADQTEALLRAVPEAYRTQINDVLLAALAQALGAWSDASVALFDLEGHGREELFDDVDLTRTVGWFTAMFPVALELPAGAGPGELLMSVKEQLRAVPNRGIGYGLLRYLRGDAELSAALRALPQAQVSFNYLGQTDQRVAEDGPLRTAREPAGPTRSPRGHRRHGVDVLASITGGCLHARFAYVEDRFRRATVASLADGFIASLQALIAHCLDPRAGGVTSSDLQMQGLTQDTIDFVVGLDPNAEDEES